MSHDTNKYELTWDLLEDTRRILENVNNPADENIRLLKMAVSNLVMITNLISRAIDWNS
jgi:hypothetical protein